MTYLRLANRNNDFFTKQLVDQLFNETKGFINENGSVYSNSRQKVNVLERENEFILELAIPGFSKEEVTLKVEKDLLKVMAAKGKKAEEQKYHRQEFVVSDFEKSFKLSGKIDQELIEAKVEDGVLRVNLPLKKEEKPMVKKIQIH